jgi:hypothetical protein
MKLVKWIDKFTVKQSMTNMKEWLPGFDGSAQPMSCVIPTKHQMQGSGEYKCVKLNSQCNTKLLHHLQPNFLSLFLYFMQESG